MPENNDNNDTNTTENEAETAGVEAAPEATVGESTGVESTAAATTDSGPTSEEQPTPAPVSESQPESEAPILQAGLKAPELEPEAVSETLPLEEQIELWRAQANRLLIILTANTSGQVDSARENLWRKVSTKVNDLLMQYGELNKTTGHKILIERTGVDVKGFLVVDVPSSSVAYAFIEDIESAVRKHRNMDEDTFIEITSPSAVDTKTAKILASTIAGFALQTYTIYGSYQPKVELFPLDQLPAVTDNRERNPLRLVK